MILKFVNKTYLFCWSSVSFTFQISIHQLNSMIQFQHLCSIINVHSDCVILHFNVLIMKKSVSLTMTAISSFNQLRLQIDFFFEINFRKLINKWVLNHESDKNQLKEILNIFEQAELHVKKLNDVVMKVWEMLIDEKIWKAKFKIKNDVIKMINISFLKNFHTCAQSSQNRKKRYIIIIKMKWEINIQNWWFKTLSKNYLDNVASVAKDWIFELTSNLIWKIIMNHLQKTQLNQDSTQSIITKNWEDMQLLDENEIKVLLSQASISNHELVRFKNSSIQLFKRWTFAVKEINLDIESDKINDDDVVMNSKSKNTSMLDFKKDESDMSSAKFEHIDEVNSADDKDEISITIHCKKKHSSCICRNIESSLLKRLRCKNARTFDIKTEIECIEMLQCIIACKLNEKFLKHICHWHFHALVDHFNLQIKKLNSAELRKCLETCWNNRNDLIAFKMTSEHIFWFQLSAQSQIKDDLHDVYAKWMIRQSIVFRSSAIQVEVIVNEIDELKTWAKWKTNENLLIQNMFVWLWAEIDSEKEHKTSIDDMILKKFDMYLYHQRERNDQSNKEWLRTMFYFLSQQIVQ